MGRQALETVLGKPRPPRSDHHKKNMARELEELGRANEELHQLLGRQQEGITEKGTISVQKAAAD